MKNDDLQHLQNYDKSNALSSTSKPKLLSKPMGKFEQSGLSIISKNQTLSTDKCRVNNVLGGNLNQNSTSGLQSPADANQSVVPNAKALVTGSGMQYDTIDQKP